MAWVEFQLRYVTQLVLPAYTLLVHILARMYRAIEYHCLYAYHIAPSVLDMLTHTIV